jgi:hypothetical protein
MCSRAKCGTCGKATYSGCGEHIEEALQGVALADRCACSGSAVQGQPSSASSGSTSSTSASGGSLLKRLFGR